MPLIMRAMGALGTLMIRQGQATCSWASNIRAAERERNNNA